MHTRRSGAFAPDLRIVVTVLVSTGIALYFWLGSRYPALDDKALMGGESPISGLAFDTVVQVLPNSALAWELAANAVNWMYTNWRGMTFGVVFGACLLTGVSLLKRRSTGNGFLDAALGGAIGAPLGVCVNCAAPIAFGLSACGMRIETALAALIASPTLNVVVVSMSFALLPFYMAALKLGTMLAFILLAIPVLSRLVFRAEANTALAARASDSRIAPGASAGLFERLLAGYADDRSATRVLPAVAWFVRTFLVNLGVVIIVTVPLMILAGVLASVIITLLPFDAILARLPTTVDFWPALAAITALAVIGVLLPVPMAFDVVVVAALMAAGLEAPYAVALLLTLGSFSIYSHLIIGRAISWRVASVTMASIAALAVAAALLTRPLSAYVERSNEAQNSDILAAAGPLTLPASTRSPAADEAEVRRQLEGKAVSWRALEAAVDHRGAGVVSIAVRSPANTASSAAASRKAFARVPGQSFGLDAYHAPTLLSAFSPFTKYHAITAGDVNGDGWDDLVLGGDVLTRGLALYLNAGGRFIRTALDLGPLGAAFVNSAALVDLDNDGWLDLHVSTFGEGTYVLWSREGRFGFNSATRLDNADAVMVGAAGYADLDGNGHLDLVLGNWVGGIPIAPYRGPHEAARNRVLWNEGGRRFSAQPLDGLPGETLAVLATDMNADGRPDIVVGDDFQGTDKIYLNGGKRTFTLAGRADGIVPWMGLSTMSLDAGDIDNDGDSDLYVGQIAMPGRLRDFRKNALPWQRICEGLVEDGAWPEGDLPACFRVLRSSSSILDHGRRGECGRLTGHDARGLCAAMALNWSEDRLGKASGCDRIPAGWPFLREMCVRAAAPRVEISKDVRRNGERFDLVRNDNFLFRQSRPGHFEDIAQIAGVIRPGWTWNAKFADLDQDGLQDLFVLTDMFTSSKLYRNLDGAKFCNVTEAFGLTEYAPAFGSVFLDAEGDGDIDVIRAPSIGYPVLYRNERPRGAALWVSVRDALGNRFGIGARIEIEVERPGAGAPLRMMREVKGSGGFNSHDAAKVHFGVPAGGPVRRLVVTWPDGAASRIAGPFPENGEVRVSRQ